jgi:cell division protein ZapA
MSEGQVTVNINGVDYPMACEPGEEEKVLALGARIDEVARRVASSSGAITETRILVMAALILTDQMSEMEDKLAKAGNTTPASSPAPSAGGEAGEADRMAEIIDSLTKRLEKLASGQTSS